MPVSVPADVLADNPILLLGGVAALVAALGAAIVYSQDAASGRLVERLMREAEKAEAFWKNAVAAEAENEEKVTTAPHAASLRPPAHPPDRQGSAGRA